MPATIATAMQATLTSVLCPFLTYMVYRIRAGTVTACSFASIAAMSYVALLLISSFNNCFYRVVQFTTLFYHECIPFG